MLLGKETSKLDNVPQQVERCDEGAQLPKQDISEFASSKKREDQTSKTGNAIPNGKPAKFSKSEPSHLYFLQKKREPLYSSSAESMSGGEFHDTINQRASDVRRSFVKNTKEDWKELSHAEWEKTGGKKKVLLEQKQWKRFSHLSKPTRRQRRRWYGKSIKFSNPEPPFFFFLRRRRESNDYSAELSDLGALHGIKSKDRVKAAASIEWRSFDKSMKQHWKDLAYAEWEKNGGKEKALLEQERRNRIIQSNEKIEC